jgi:hypothetical protein
MAPTWPRGRCVCAHTRHTQAHTHTHTHTAHTHIHTHTHLAFPGVLGELMPCCADFGFGLGHSVLGRPACRRQGHGIDEVDLHIFGHPIQGHVLAAGGNGRPVWIQLDEGGVTLFADRLRAGSVALWVWCVCVCVCARIKRRDDWKLNTRRIGRRQGKHGNT